MTRSTMLGAALLATVLGATGSRVPNTASPRAPWLAVGTPDIKSAGALTFSPDGLLLVGDSRGSALFALSVGDSAGSPGDTVSLARIDEKIAARLGARASDVRINDIAVHPTSHAVYLSVSRGLGADSRPAIVRVAAGGRITVVSLSQIAFAKATLPNPPAIDAKDTDGDFAAASTITDLAVVKGTVIVAGLSNDEFSSVLRRVPLPFDGSVKSTAVRVFHAHHNRFETRSPITALTPYTADGRDYILASYACTPITILPVDSLVDGANVTGKTIAEIGAGTHATDLITYETGGRRYLAVNTIGRSLQILEADALAAAPALDLSSRPEPKHPLGSWFTWGVRSFGAAQPGVIHIANFDASWTEVLQRDIVTGALNLRPLRKPILWPQ